MNLKNVLIQLPEEIKIKQIQYLLIDTSVRSRAEVSFLYSVLTQLESLLYEYITNKNQKEFLTKYEEKFLNNLFEFRKKMNTKYILLKMKDYVEVEKDEGQKSFFEKILKTLEEQKNMDIYQLKEEIAQVIEFLKKKLRQQIVMNSIFFMVNKIVNKQKNAITEDELVNEFLKQMDAVDQIQKTYDTVKMIRLDKQTVGHEQLESLINEIQLKKVIKSGFKTFDSIVGGFENQRVYLILGKTGFGKSQFILNLAVNFIKQGYNVLFITLENTLEETKERLLSCITKIPMKLLAVNKEKVIQKLREFYEQYPTGTIYIEYYPSDTLTSSLLRNKILMKDKKIDVVIVDYLDLLKGKQQETERIRVMKLVRELKRVQQETDVIILSPSQIHREAYRKKIVEVDNVAESFGKIQEQDGVLILEQTQEELQRKEMRLNIGKMRHGKSGVRIKFKVDFENMTFEDQEEIVNISEVEMEPLKFEEEISDEKEDIDDNNLFGLLNFKV